MKKIISLLAILLTFSVSSQTLIKPKQIEGSTAGSILTTTGTGVPTWTTNIPASTTKAWRIDGNAVGSNTAFIGTTDNRSLRTVINGSVITKIDTLGNFYIGSSIVPNSLGIGRFRVNHGGLNVDIGSHLFGFAGMHITSSVAPNYTNFAVYGDGTTSCYFNSPSDSSTSVLTCGNSGLGELQIKGTQRYKTTPSFQFNAGPSSKNTAGLNTPKVIFFSNNSGWLTGAIATQYNYQITAPTYSAVGASTMTDAYTLFTNLPIQSTNMTITNKWGLGTSGSAHITQSVLIGSAAQTPSATADIRGTLLTTGSSSLANITTSLISPTGTLIQIAGASNSINIGSSNSASVFVSGILTANSLITATGGFNATAASSVTGTALNVTGASSSFNLFPTTTEGINVKRRGSATTCLSFQSDASSNASVTVTNADFLLSALAFRTQKIYGNSSAPTVTAGSGLGTGAGTVISVTGNDMDGIIGVTTGTTGLGTSAVLTYITFNVAYVTNAPIMVISPYNGAAANLTLGSNVFMSASTATAALNTYTAALPANTTFSWSYHALGR